jgi:hypothetical protein
VQLKLTYTGSALELGTLDVAILIMLAIGYAAWQLRLLGKSLTAVSAHLRVLSEAYASTIAEQQQEKDDYMRTAVAPVAKTIVFGRCEIFEPQAGGRGVGVFSVRNVGAEAVLALGVTRTEADGPPPEAGAQILTGADPVEFYVTLEPNLPPLDLARVTLWYRDLSARVWLRSFAAPHAVRFASPADEAEAPDGEPGTEGAEAAPGEAVQP